MDRKGSNHVPSVSENIKNRGFLKRSPRYSEGRVVKILSRALIIKISDITSEIFMIKTRKPRLTRQSPNLN